MAKGTVADSSAWENRLYAYEDESIGQGDDKKIAVMAIPYFAWANREPATMCVWTGRSHDHDCCS